MPSEGARTGSSSFIASSTTTGVPSATRRPGSASTTLTYLVYKEALLDFDAGTAAAGGVVAVILANIVAIFLMRAIGKNLDA